MAREQLGKVDRGSQPLQSGQGRYSLDQHWRSGGGRRKKGRGGEGRGGEGRGGEGRGGEGRGGEGRGGTLQVLSYIRSARI